MGLPPDIAPRWREMDDETRARAYSPSSAIGGNYQPFVEAYRTRSDAAHAALPQTRSIHYGPNTLDLVTPKGPGPHPLLVFFHGGYWQELSKEDAFGSAPDAIARGIAFAAPGYGLAPETSLPEIVDQCRAAVAHLILHAEEYGIDPDRVVVSGSSAGAHLAAIVAATLPVSGAVLLSGIYDLEPLVGTYINDALGLDAQTARALSPVTHDLTRFPPTLLAWGADETDEFKRQSRSFAHLLPKADTVEIAGRNHFDVIEDLINGSALGQKTAHLFA